MENNRYREEEKELNENVEEPIKEEVREEIDGANHEEPVKGSKKSKQRIKELEELNDELQNKIIYLQDQLLRNQAELENFKKRTNEERIKERKYAMQDYFSEVIDVIDVFDKAVSVKTEDEKLQKFLKGFAMVNMQMKKTLESYGVTKIEALNKPFDPAYHEAFEVVEAEGVESDTVVAVLTEGYMYKDRILRPSVVKLSK
jgi:molecular chaperone GrpE